MLSTPEAPSPGAPDTERQGSPKPFTLVQTIAQWWRDASVQGRRLRSAGAMLSAFASLLRDLTPERRRLRFGDIDFDCDHRVDTTWAKLPLAIRLREIFIGRPYQPTEPVLFHQIISSLASGSEPLVARFSDRFDLREFTFIDLGSGKGRALLLASDYPFRRIIGVELLPELHAIAQQNVAHYNSATQQCRNFQFWCGDARQFPFPRGPLLLFLFDPFPEHVLRQVLSNLAASVTGCPRKVVVVYQNPVQEGVFATAAPWLQKIAGTIQYAIFRN